MEREYGIGRLTADTDPVEEAMAEIEAERIQPTVRHPRPQQKYMTCRKCGQGGYTGEYPFSTCPGSGLCDDCF